MSSSFLEQLLLEYINDARLDPVGDTARYITSYSPLTSNNASIQQALNQFAVNGTQLKTDIAALAPVDPLAWNDNISTAAHAHNAVLMAQNIQSHQAPGEKELAQSVPPFNNDRLDDAGYSWSTAAENVFVSSNSII